MIIALIRHGVTQGNIENRHIGITDIPLAPQGEILARSVAPFMKPMEAVYSSSMLRARQTAAILFPTANIVFAPGLYERDFGLWEKKTPEDLEDDPYYSVWRHGEASAPPEGESRVDLIARCSDAFQHLLKEAEKRGEKSIAIVTHGNVIMALMTCFAGNCGEDYFDWIVDNCGGYLLQTEETERGLHFHVLENHRGGWNKDEKI